MPIIEAPGIEQSDGVINRVFPTGKYSAQLVEITIGENKAKTGLRAELTWKFEPTNPDGVSGEQIRTWAAIPNKNTMDERTYKYCLNVWQSMFMACGKRIDSSSFDTDAIKNDRCILEVVEKDGQNNVKNFHPIS